MNFYNKLLVSHIWHHTAYFLDLFSAFSHSSLGQSITCAKVFSCSVFTILSIVARNFVYIHVASQNKRTLRDFSCSLKQLVTRRVFSPPESIKDLGQVGDPQRLNFSPNADTLAPISSYMIFPTGQSCKVVRRLFIYAALARACVNLISARRRGRPFFARSFVAAPSTACNLSNAFGLVNNALARIHTLAGSARGRRQNKDKSGSVRVTLYCGGGSGGGGSPGQLSIKTTYAELIRRRSSYKGCWFIGRFFRPAERSLLNNQRTHKEIYISLCLLSCSAALSPWELSFVRGGGGKMAFWWRVAAAHDKKKQKQRETPKSASTP